MAERQKLVAMACMGDDDLDTVVHLGFGQDRKTARPPQRQDRKAATAPRLTQPYASIAIKP